MYIGEHSSVGTGCTGQEVNFFEARIDVISIVGLQAGI